MCGVGMDPRTLAALFASSQRFRLVTRLPPSKRIILSLPLLLPTSKIRTQVVGLGSPVCLWLTCGLEGCRKTVSLPFGRFGVSGRIQ